MGIEHNYGGQLVALVDGRFPTTHGVPQNASTINQKMQRAALNIAAAFAPGAVADRELQHEVLDEAIAQHRSQLQGGHQGGIGPKGAYSEAAVAGNHASIWLAAEATLLWLAFVHLTPYLKGSLASKVTTLRVLTRQWWTQHMALLHQGADLKGHIVLPRARAYEEAFAPTSYHEDAIYRELMGLPHEGNARKEHWWAGDTPDAVGPHYVRFCRKLFPTKDEITDPGNLPKLTNALTIEHYEHGHVAYYERFSGMGTQKVGTGGPTLRAWADYHTGESGYDTDAPESLRADGLSITTRVPQV